MINVSGPVLASTFVLGLPVGLAVKQILRGTTSLRSWFAEECETDPGTFRWGARLCLRLEAGLGWQPGLVGTTTITPGDSFAGYSFLHKTPVQVADLSRERRFAVPDHLSAHDIRAGIVMPVGVREQPIGVLAAYYHATHRFGDEERRVLMSIAHQTALALEKVRLYTELGAKVRELQQTQNQSLANDDTRAELKGELLETPRSVATRATSALPKALRSRDSSHLRAAATGELTPPEP